MKDWAKLKSITRNLIVGFGVYQLSWWVAYPLAFAFGKFTDGIIYRGEFAGAALMPLLTNFPYALVALGVGACVASLVDSERPFRWAIFPAALYIYFGITGYHWARQPLLADRMAQVIGAVFLGITCLGGALLAVRRPGSFRQLG